MGPEEPAPNIRANRSRAITSERYEIPGVRNLALTQGRDVQRRLLRSRRGKPPPRQAANARPVCYFNNERPF